MLWKNVWEKLNTGTQPIMVSPLWLVLPALNISGETYVRNLYCIHCPISPGLGSARVNQETVCIKHILSEIFIHHE